MITLLIIGHDGIFISLQEHCSGTLKCLVD